MSLASFSPPLSSSSYAPRRRLHAGTRTPNTLLCGLAARTRLCPPAPPVNTDQRRVLRLPQTILSSFPPFRPLLCLCSARRNTADHRAFPSTVFLAALATLCAPLLRHLLCLSSQCAGSVLQLCMPLGFTQRAVSKAPGFRATGRSTGAFDFNSEEEWFEAGI